MKGALVVAAGLLLSVLAGCGDEAEPASAEQRERALAAGFDADLVYVLEVDGYQPVAGGSGVYGDAGYQAIYASAQASDLRLTVERGSMDDATCAALPIPAAEPVDAVVQCTREGDGWHRVAGDRQEYAEEAHRAGARDLEAALPPTPESGRPEIVERGDITGDNAPDNSVGAEG